MHIRQVVLVAHDLEPVFEHICAVFDLEVGFRDPGVAESGLRNAVIPVGTTFLEVVSPVREDATAARFLRRRGGDGGYMVILQTADLDADRHRLTALGVRVVWQTTLDDIATVHLHPRDIGGAIVSLDQPRPPASWRWAGPEWAAKVRRAIVGGLTSVTLGGPDPSGLAARWAEVLGLRPPRPVGDGFEIGLEPGVLRFVDADGRGEGIVAIGVAAVDARRAVDAARARGL